MVREIYVFRLILTINFIFVGVGYHLILSKDANSDPNQIFQLVHRHVEEAKLESAISAECKILLPHSSSTKFPVLFEDIERNKDTLQIFSIGLSETSIEEVFMKMYKNKK
jgi:ATP-binding cassette subfamily A (ABC1) protein 3